MAPTDVKRPRKPPRDLRRAERPRRVRYLAEGGERDGDGKREEGHAKGAAL